MKSRAWIGTVLITLVIVTILAAGGYALYRYGYARGQLVVSMGEGFLFDHFGGMPFADQRGAFPRGRFGGLPGGGLEGYPQHFHDRMRAYECFAMPHHFDQAFGPRMAPYGRVLPPFWSYSPFSIVLAVLLIGLVIWLLYRVVSLFTGEKSWKLSFRSDAAEVVEEEAKAEGRSRKK